MPWTAVRKTAVPPMLAGKRLNSTRLRRSASVPTRVPTTRAGRCLHRLAWRFGRGRL